MKQDLNKNKKNKKNPSHKAKLHIKPTSLAETNKKLNFLFTSKIKNKNSILLKQYFNKYIYGFFGQYWRLIFFIFLLVAVFFTLSWFAGENKILLAIIGFITPLLATFCSIIYYEYKEKIKIKKNDEKIHSMRSLLNENIKKIIFKIQNYYLVVLRDVNFVVETEIKEKITKDPKVLTIVAADYQIDKNFFNQNFDLPHLIIQCLKKELNEKKTYLDDFLDFLITMQEMLNNYNEMIMMSQLSRSINDKYFNFQTMFHQWKSPYLWQQFIAPIEDKKTKQLSL